METPRKEPPPMRGLYGKVNISVKTLDKIIVGGIIVMVLIILMGLSKRGYTVDFNSMGGTFVEAQPHMYGELVSPPAEPTREGYSFIGWFQDERCIYPWDMEKDIVSASITLYAAWEPIA